MVEQALHLDTIFGSLADPIRRDILRRVSNEELSVSQIAAGYEVTLAAISKHLKILENARLIVKRRQGKQQLVQVAPAAFHEATDYLKQYEAIWNHRMDAIDAYLQNDQ